MQIYSLYTLLCVALVFNMSNLNPRRQKLNKEVIIFEDRMAKKFLKLVTEMNIIGSSLSPNQLNFIKIQRR